MQNHISVNECSDKLKHKYLDTILVKSHTLESLIHHGLQNLHISSTEAGPKSFAEVFGHVGSNVNTDLISQCCCTHWEPKACGESIQLLGVDTFL